MVDAVPLQSFLPAFAWVARGLPLLAGLWVVVHAPGLAAPLGHKGSTIISGEFDPHWSFFTVTPALTRTSGVGPALHWLVPQASHQGSKEGPKKRPIRSTPPPSTRVGSTRARGSRRQQGKAMIRTPPRRAPAKAARNSGAWCR
jgi:hypothetical protein